MRTSVLLATGILLALHAAARAQDGARFVRQVAFPTGPQVAVVAEGDLEPSSVGSYSLRVYSGARPEFPLDDFVVGVIRPRNGAVEEVRFAVVDADRVADLVVIIRAVGTGAYVSADAFRFRGRALTLLGSVSDLERGADPIRALQTAIRRRAEPAAAPPVPDQRR